MIPIIAVWPRHGVLALEWWQKIQTFCEYKHDLLQAFSHSSFFSLPTKVTGAASENNSLLSIKEQQILEIASKFCFEIGWESGENSVNEKNKWPFQEGSSHICQMHNMVHLYWKRKNIKRHFPKHHFCDAPVSVHSISFWISSNQRNAWHDIDK